MIFVTKNKEIEKLDVKDKKIITYLHHNLDIPKKKLAKELNIGESNLNYKIQRLEKKNILTPLLLLNFRKLGFKHYNLFLYKISKEELEELSNASEVSVILQTFGSKKIILEIITKDLNLFLEKYLSNQKVEIIELFSDYFHTSNCFQINLNKKLLIEKKIITDPTALNFIDAKIILSLSKNPQLSILGLAKETKLNRQTITKHLEKLKNQEIIYKKILGINVFTLSFEEYFLKISYILEDKEKIFNLILQNPYISISSFSFQTILIDIQVPNYHLLAEFIEKIESISNNVSTESFQILNVKKISSLPKIVEEELNKIL